MINAAIVGLGWWGKTLVESVQGSSDVIRFVAGATRTSSPEVSAFAEAGKTLGGSDGLTGTGGVPVDYPVLPWPILAPGRPRR